MSGLTEHQIRTTCCILPQKVGSIGWYHHYSVVAGPTALIMALELVAKVDKAQLAMDQSLPYHGAVL